jgi:mRNA interferase RelE/StbE
MNVTYTKQFVKDVEKYPLLKVKVFEIIETFKNSKTLFELKNIKKLKATGNYYRLKIGSFRIGFSFSENTITFYRFLHRNDIYRFFP